MGGGFGGSPTLGQVQSRHPLFADGVGCIVQVRVGATLKAKTGVALVKAFDKILKQGRKPNHLQTDRGKEFYNRTFQRWVKDHGIDHFSTEGDAKAAVVERFNRTLKERLYRYFTAANTLRFDDKLPQLVEGYNATRHHSIGMAPQDVTWDNEEAV